MENAQIEKLIAGQRSYFDSGKTKSYSFRMEQLKKLKAAIKKYEPEILDALHADMHKPRFESYISEVGILYEEIGFVMDHLNEWMHPETVHTPLALHPSSSTIYAEPLGLVLIIGPWNYPFQLLMTPLIGAIAGGNCCVLKPSDNTRHTANLIEKLIAETFDPQFVAVVQGPGAVVGTQLIEQFRFDHIFFTGSANVGKQIMRMAAEHLSPVTLELGGKSPAIVDKEVNIDIAAKRLIWSKCFNAGQTCICPDYVLVHSSVKEELIKRMIHYIREFFGENPLVSENYTHIVNDKRFEILKSYLSNVNIIHGGRSDAATRCIEPTLMDDIPENHPLMQEEIFGPLLPVLTFNDIQEVISIVKKHRYPLACYLYTTNKATEELVMRSIEFGGGCVNNGLVHLANPELPFGGIGFSGIGKYHGKYSFETFTHKKSVVKTSFFFDPTLRYPPYTNSKDKWAHFFMK